MRPKNNVALDIQITFKEIEITEAIKNGKSNGKIRKLEVELEELQREWSLNKRKPSKVPKNYDNRIFEN